MWQYTYRGAEGQQCDEITRERRFEQGSTFSNPTVWCRVRARRSGRGPTSHSSRISLIVLVGFFGTEKGDPSRSGLRGYP